MPSPRPPLYSAPSSDYSPSLTGAVRNMSLLAHRIQRLLPRHALRRVVGLLVLAVMARQTTSFAWVRCDTRSVPAPTTASMPTGAHHHAAPAPSQDTAPQAPVGCNHQSPADCCGVGSGCVSLAVTPPHGVFVSVATHTLVAPSTPSAPLALSLAPADPPPRA